MNPPRLAIRLVFGIAGFAAFAALAVTSAHAELFSKDILSLRDPFKRPSVTGNAGAGVSDLEQYPVERFKYLGVVIGATHNRAMLVAPNGKSYFVHENMRIGPRKGVIVKITSDKVIVRERFMNVLGQEEVSDVSIEMPTEQMSGLRNR